MVGFWVTFASAQSREEIQRQYDVVQRMELRHRLLTVLAYMMATTFLPFKLCAVLCVLDTLLDWAGMSLMKGIDPPKQKLKYAAMLLVFIAAQSCYSVVPMLVWQIESPFAKAYAVGATLVTIVQLATVRTVHLPLAFVSWITVSAGALSANIYYWIGVDNDPALLFSTACVVVASYFSLITMQTVHGLHDEMLSGQIAAQAAHESKTRFLAQMSHELRTPLNAILGMGYAELIRARDAMSRGRLETLIASARSLGVLLDDILDLSAVQAGHLPIRPVPLALRAEIGSTLDLFRPQIGAAGLSIHLGFENSVPEVVVLDGQRLRQCLSNILNNAIKHTREGGITVHVACPTGTTMTLEVSDTGPGIPDERTDDIFVPFHRGPDLLTGTGLGLSISRALAREMGGDLVLMPSPIGARFLLSLEIEVTTADALPMPPDLSIQWLLGLTGLVVDDIATNRLVAATYLGLFGARVKLAEGGKEALSLIARMRPDFILLDMNMPEMNGLEVLSQLRAMQGGAATIPVIAMTADASEQHRVRYLAAGLDGYVAKPLTPEKLIEAILPLVARPVPPPPLQTAVVRQAS